MKKVLGEEIKRFTKEYIELIAKRIELITKRNELEEIIFGNGVVDESGSLIEEILQKEADYRKELEDVINAIVRVDEELKRVISIVNILRTVLATI